MAKSILDNLISKLRNGKAKIGIIGLGYIGLPLAIRFTGVGYSVIGFDIDPIKVDKLNKGISYIKHIENSSVSMAVSQDFHATVNFKEIKDCDGVIICVPTPLNSDREPDLSFVLGTMDALVPHLRVGQVISLESTTYPGTTEEELLPLIETAGYDVGREIFLVYSPEREDPGNSNFSTASIPKICGGHTPACLEAGVALYNNAIDTVIPVSSTKVAEMTKLLENIHRAVNIGLVNEMKVVADAMGINIHEVIDAAKTKPFGFTPYYPGPGLGGHCIPIDPFYLAWKAKQYGINARFVELAGEINTAMPKWVVSKVIAALKSVKKEIFGSKILVLGIAYKKNVDDMRESPSAELIKLLHEQGAQVEYSDPYIPAFPRMREYSFDMESIKLTANSLERFDLVLLATDHDDLDYRLIRSHAKLIVDTRGRFAKSLSRNIISA